MEKSWKSEKSGTTTFPTMTVEEIKREVKGIVSDTTSDPIFFVVIIILLLLFLRAKTRVKEKTYIRVSV